ncbi:MAG TPA: hypothetical protein DET40_24550 [Lentisphaeria bacterium]|jgi:signal transduction histidine kinase|nr:MAG: hypothetical protein A2X45_22945 [Lentisphaerae bacterium GWF2_50_93]HCE46730.1 hypothetical protein [Lentisphaeria bacterium]
MKNKTQISIAFYVALVSAFITAIGMGVYAVYQFYSHPGHTITGLMLEHGWHVIALGFLTYLVSYLLFHFQITRPISSLWMKCYAMTRGYEDNITVTSSIKEIQEIADAIDMLKAQLSKNKNEPINKQNDEGGTI